MPHPENSAAAVPKKNTVSLSNRRIQPFTVFFVLLPNDKLVRQRTRQQGACCYAARGFVCFLAAVRIDCSVLINNERGFVLVYHRSRSSAGVKLVCTLSGKGSNINQKLNGFPILLQWTFYTVHKQWKKKRKKKELGQASLLKAYYYQSTVS